MQPEIPEEGIKMFIVKKDKGVALSEEEKMKQELSMALEEHEQNEDEVETPDELSPAGKLAYNIADHLAEVTAERFSEMIDGLDMDIAKQIVRRLQASDAEALVGMLQEMFLIKGMAHAAEELDLLKECEEYEESIYWRFQDTLSDQDVFEWFRINSMIENCGDEECSAVIRIPVREVD